MGHPDLHGQDGKQYKMTANEDTVPVVNNLPTTNAPELAGTNCPRSSLLRQHSRR